MIHAEIEKSQNSGLIYLDLDRLKVESPSTIHYVLHFYATGDFNVLNCSASSDRITSTSRFFKNKQGIARKLVLPLEETRARALFKENAK